MSPRPGPQAQVVRRLPAQFTSFVGRATEVSELTRLVSENRLVTLCGAGGVGKTRLAIQVAPMIAPQFADGICYLDLAPISDPAVVPMALTRALEIADLPGRSSLERVVRWLGDGRMLLVIDNCEHLIDVCASMVVELMSACPGLTILTTSREPLAVAGELTWRVHSLPLNDEAVALFADRARLARPEFHMGADAAPVVLDVCRQLDGMPLAIELAAARMGAMSLVELANSLQGRFSLLTGGARTALPRHQTLRASVDWSHALLTESERVVFRRLAVFAGGFDLAAAAAVAGDDDIPTNTELLSLVDKSLVTTEENDGLTRYRLLETVRQFAFEKLSDSGEFDAIRAGHGDYYSALAAELDEPDRAGDQQFIDRVEAEIDNLRAAFAWFRGVDVAAALRLASSLQPLWLGRGHTREGLAWFEAIADEIASCPDTAAIVRALSESAMIDVWMGEIAVEKSLAGAQKALVLARNSGDPALLVRALVACGSLLGYNAAAARPYLDEAIGIARATGDRWRLSQILFWQAAGAFVAGDPTVGREAAEEGLEIAEAIGDRYVARLCGVWLGYALLWQGHVEDAIAQFESLVTEADWGTDLAARAVGLLSLGQALAYRGDTAAARKVSDEAVAAASEFGGVYEGSSHAVVTYVALAAGDVATGRTAAEAAWRLLRAQPDMAAMFGPIMAQAALAGGDVTAARNFADAAVDMAPGWHRMFAFTTRSRVALAQGEFREAERAALAALSCAVKEKAYLCVADAIECVAAVAGVVGDGLVAARLAGAAESARKQTGESRFLIFQASYDSFVGELCGAIGEEQLASAWADGARLSIEQAIAYAVRGRRERKRPSSGWAALTPTERDVVRLVSRGLSNKEIASELFISVRTVQTHLTHVYAKLGAKSRIQIARQAARYV
jgi:predicted ATPase/DNA-binding CsgD family transcriptional regulator